MNRIPFFNIRAHIPLIKCKWGKNSELWTITNRQDKVYIPFIGFGVVTAIEEGDKLGALFLTLGPLNILFFTPWLSDLLVNLCSGKED